MGNVVIIIGSLVCCALCATYENVGGLLLISFLFKYLILHLKRECCGAHFVSCPSVDKEPMICNDDLLLLLFVNNYSLRLRIPAANINVREYLFVAQFSYS